jgi:hypothetical protein
MLRWNGSKHIPQELVGAFIKADDGTQRIIRLSVEIEDVLHAPEEVCPNLTEAPLPLLPRLEPVFFERPPDRLIRDLVGHIQLDELVDQELHSPVLPPLGWRTTGEGNQMGFPFQVELGPAALPIPFGDASLVPGRTASGCEQP